MQVHPRLEDAIIELAFPDASALRAFLQEAEEQQAFMLDLPAAPSPFTLYSITLAMGDWFELPFQAPVVQTFDAGGGCRTVFQFDPWSGEQKVELEARLRGEDAGAPPTPAPSDEPEIPAGEMVGVSPIMRIKKMQTPERMRLAAKADRSEKSILLRDSSAQVLLALLNNPHLGADDVRTIAASTHASTSVLERIAKERRWTANSQVQRALVQNPKTPVPLALRFIEHLPTEDLRKLAKIQSGLKEKLRSAALKAYLKRSERR